MIIRFMSLVSVLVASAALGDQTVLGYPIPLILPTPVAQRWGDVEQLSEYARQSDNRGTLVKIQRPLRAEHARVDVFDRVERGCQWSAVFHVPSDGELRLPDTGKPRCILVRNGVLYGFAVVPETSKDVTIDAVRDVGPLEGDRDYVMFVPDEAQPRWPGRDRCFVAVPAAESVLLCEWRATALETCSVVDPLQPHPSGNSVSSSYGVRVVRSVGDSQVDAWTEGRSVMMPAKQPVRSIEVRGWKVLSVDAAWQRVVVDWGAAGRATVRSTGIELPPLPSFRTIALVPTTGIAVRPLVGKEQDRIVEPEARLALFLDRADVAGRIAVAVVKGDEEGVFRAERLAGGEYRMKLVSALAADDVVRAQLGEETTEVRFPSGPVVRGRVVLRSTTATTALPVIRVVPAVAGDDGASRDPAALIREVLTRNDGQFRVALAAGRYVLRATWSGAIAERAFELREGAQELDLGQIELGRATTLHGSIAGCEGGEIRMIPLPSSETRQTAIPFFDVRRTVVRDGRFEFETMWAGEWLASAVCAGTRYLLTPRTVLIPEAADGELFVQFSTELQ
jgi:hypothetical protein